MATKTQTLLDIIADEPGLTSAQLGDRLGIPAGTVSALLRYHVTAGDVATDLVPRAQGSPVLAYRLARPRRGQMAEHELSEFVAAFDSDGTLRLKVGLSRWIQLSRWQAIELVRFLDDAVEPQTIGAERLRNGTLYIRANGRRLDVASDHVERLMRYLDSINVDQIAVEAAERGR